MSWYSLKTLSLAARLSKPLFQHGHNSANNNKKYFYSSRYYTSINLNLNATWFLQLRGRMQNRFQYLLTVRCPDSPGSCSWCGAVGEMRTCRSASLLSGSVFSKASAGGLMRILITLQGRPRASSHLLISHLIIGFYSVKVCFENYKWRVCERQEGAATALYSL